MTVKRSRGLHDGESVESEGRAAYRRWLSSNTPLDSDSKAIGERYAAELLKVLAAHTLYMSNRKKGAQGVGTRDPRSPLAKWFARKELDLYRESFEVGYLCVLDALDTCLTHGLQVPAWLSAAYQDAFRRSKIEVHRSWDEAFGRPIPKGTHATRLTRRRYLQYAIYNFVSDEREGGSPIDEALFERTGARFGVGKTLASTIYYEAKNMIESLP